MEEGDFSKIRKHVAYRRFENHNECLAKAFEHVLGRSQLHYYSHQSSLVYKNRCRWQNSINWQCPVMLTGRCHRLSKISLSTIHCSEKIRVSVELLLFSSPSLDLKDVMNYYVSKFLYFHFLNFFEVN